MSESPAPDLYVSKVSDVAGAASAVDRRITPTVDMIASNIDPASRAVPSIAAMSIVQDLYDLAAYMRAGSVRPGADPTDI